MCGRTPSSTDCGDEQAASGDSTPKPGRVAIRSPARGTYGERLDQPYRSPPRIGHHHLKFSHRKCCAFLEMLLALGTQDAVHRQRILVDRQKNTLAG